MSITPKHLTTKGSTTQCNKGSESSHLQPAVAPLAAAITASPLIALTINGLKTITVLDVIPGINIRPFGTCSITGTPCTFAPAGIWSPPQGHLSVGGALLVINGSTLKCSIGGTVTAISASQTDASTSTSTPSRELPTKELNTLAVFAILEGPGDLRNTHEQLKVAAVVINRTNSSNWKNDYGPTISDQLFATDIVDGNTRHQFEVMPIFGLKRTDFVSLDSATQALSDAKDGFDYDSARDAILNFKRAAADPNQYSAAAEEIGNATGFRGGTDGMNKFRQESSYDDDALSEKQPGALVESTAN